MQSLLPGVPLIESPLFEAALDEASLTASERKLAVTLNREGIAVIDFPDPEIDARIDRIKERLAPIFGLEMDENAELKVTGKYRIQDAWSFDEDVRAIAANAEIAAMLSRLYGKTAFPFQTLNFPVGTQQAVHSDSVHFSSIPERFMCGVWLAMEDVGPNAGPLRYIPGSHSWPVLSNTMVGRHGWGAELRSAQDPYQEVWAALIAASGLQEKSLEVKKGQAVIWCANLLHGGGIRHDHKLTRWSQVTHYFFDECVYYTPAYSDEPLGRLALRDIINVADGRPKPNSYLGEAVKSTGPASKHKKNALKRLFGRINKTRRSRSPIF